MRVILFILLVISSFTTSYSQKWKLTRYEASIGIGFANYFGDIGGSADKNNWYGVRDIALLSTRPSFIASARYKITSVTSVKANFALAMLSGNDEGSSRDYRKYSFNSYGFEHSVQFEYSIITEDARQNSFAVFNRRGMLNNYSKKNLYFFAGVGGLLVKPVLSKNNTAFHDSHEVMSNDMVYTLVIPVGIGLKIIYSNKYSIGVEFGGRYAFSDMIDGFTYPPSSNFNDIYYFTSVNLIYRIKTSRKGYPILFKNY